MLDVTDTIDETEEKPAHEKAVLDSLAGFDLFGEPLSNYSASRKVAAQAMGLLYPYIGEAGASQMEATGIYAGVVKDMAIVLWLMTLPDPMDLTVQQIRAKPWTPARALMKPQEALEEAVCWAESVNIVDTASDKFQEALATFMAILAGQSASEFRLQMESTRSTGPQEVEDPKA